MGHGGAARGRRDPRQGTARLDARRGLRSARPRRVGGGACAGAEGRLTCFPDIRRTEMIRRLLAVAILLGWSGGAFAQPLNAPSGPVMLTVTGKIAQTNRGPFDEKRDA